MAFPTPPAARPIRIADLAGEKTAEVLDRLDGREWLRDRTRRFGIHAAPHQEALTNEDDDGGLDALG